MISMPWAIDVSVVSSVSLVFNMPDVDRNSPLFLLGGVVDVVEVECFGLALYG